MQAKIKLLDLLPLQYRHSIIIFLFFYRSRYASLANAVPCTEHPVDRITSTRVINVSVSFMANDNKIQNRPHNVDCGGSYGHAQSAKSHSRNEMTLTRKKCCYLIVTAALTPCTSWAS